MCLDVQAASLSGIAVPPTHHRASAVSVDSDDDGDPSAGHAGPASPPTQQAPRRKGRRLTVSNCRAPVQMALALACACVLATAPKSSAAFQNKGEWITITVAMALEGTVGATKRKAALRALGTALGGILGSGVVAFTIGVAPTTTAKVGIISTLLGLSGMFVQAMRARDASRDYAYLMVLTTLALTIVTGFKADTVAAALQLIAWRMASIACGGLIAFGVSALILPEFASDAARNVLADILEDASALLCAAVGEYTHSDASGCVFGAAKGDLYAQHAHLHALEARTAKRLERFSVLLTQAREEVELPPLLRARPLPLERYAAAGAAARSVFTGAVALLHGMESGLHACALCHAHRRSIRGAQRALAACFADVARLARHTADAAQVHASLGALEAAVERLAQDVAVESVSAAIAVDAALLRHNVHALGAVCFSLGDAAHQAALIAHAIEPEAAKALGVGGSMHAHDDGGKSHAPGGGLLAAGGSHMAAALRGAAHALDAALHSHLSGTFHHSASAGAIATDSRSRHGRQGDA